MIQKLIVVAAMLIVAVGCKKVDLVNGVPAVDAHLADVQVAVARIPANQRSEFIRSHYPDLGRQVVGFLRERGKIQPAQNIGSVEFFFGSRDRARAEDRNGQIHEGFFKDQLVARVHVAGIATPIDVLVRCMNGTFDLPGDLTGAGFASLGTQRPVERFTIGRNDSLVRHVGYRTAIDLAERHGIPLFRGRGKNRRAITPAEARRLESETDRIQVAATVFEGDRFDLVAGTYTPAPKPTPIKRNRRNRR